jgi:hypothetical protein
MCYSIKLAHSLGEETAGMEGVVYRVLHVHIEIASKRPSHLS